MIYATKTITDADGNETTEHLSLSFWQLVHELKAYENLGDPKFFEIYEPDQDQNFSCTIQLGPQNDRAAASLWRKAFEKSRGVRAAWLPLRCDFGV